jgi:hypothetical protein|tara:strand:- start:10 stop:459 length:450 start_codon:yes stop_codon:yes gene_type:complete
MIDKDRLFQLFGNSEEENPEVQKLANADTEFMKSPEAKLGMFTKMIYNHEVFHAKLKKFFQKEKTTFNADETKEASSFAVFNRAYSYIKNLNINNAEHQDALWEFNSKPLFKALNQAIYYFEAKEEYEKCAKLLEIKEMKKALEKDVPM